MRIRSVGSQAILLEVDDPAAWFLAVTRRRAAGELAVVDVVPGARTLLLDGLPDPEATAALLRTWPTPAAALDASATRLVAIPVDFDGEDLGFVANHWQCDEQDVIDRVTETELRVAFCGFAPGFAYLSGLPADWTVPRLATPRSRVPAGSVALAGAYAGVYPTASPGGWRLIGRTDQVLFDPDSSPPAVLTPGVRVRLINKAEPSGQQR